MVLFFIPTQIPEIPTQISEIPTHVPEIPNQIPEIPTQIPEIPCSKAQTSDQIHGRWPSLANVHSHVSAVAIS